MSDPEHVTAPVVIDASPPTSDGGPSMTLIEHLAELRRRLIIVVSVVLVGAVAGFFVSTTVLRLLVDLLPSAYQTLYFTSPAGAFGAQLKIGGFTGLAIAMPVLLFQAYRFITPGLTRKERRLVWPGLVAALVLFMLGIGLGYLVLPYMLQFLIGVAPPDITSPLFTIDEYIGFVTTTLLAFGLVLEFPIVLIVLARVGILSHAFLARRRRWAILLIVIVAIVLTPGSDPISPTIMGLVMYVLFEGSLLVIRRFRG
jgi:sec-independent protein translocase protein TatC